MSLENFALKVREWGEGGSGIFRNGGVSNGGGLNPSTNYDCFSQMKLRKIFIV